MASSRTSMCTLQRWGTAVHIQESGGNLDHQGQGPVAERPQGRAQLEIRMERWAGVSSRKSPSAKLRGLDPGAFAGGAGCSDPESLLGWRSQPHPGMQRDAGASPLLHSWSQLHSTLRQGEAGQSTISHVHQQGNGGSQN